MVRNTQAGICPGSKNKSVITRSVLFRMPQNFRCKSKMVCTNEKFAQLNHISILYAVLKEFCQKMNKSNNGRFSINWKHVRR